MKPRALFLVIAALLVISIGFNIYLLRQRPKAASTQQVASEAIPDSGVMAALSTLKPVKPSDTLKSKMLLTINGRNFLTRDYLAARAYMKARQYGLVPVSSRLPLAVAALTELPENEVKLQDLQNLLEDEAKYLMGDTLYRDGPLPHRIHYSWGRKDYTVADRPTDSCHEVIHGMDCSGFIEWLFNHIDNRIHMREVKAKDEVKEPFLESVLKSYFGEAKFKADPIGPLDNITDVQRGDILYLKNASGVVSHIGIVFRNNDSVLSFYNCSGSPYYKPNDSAWCSLNQSARFGMSVGTLTNDFLRKKTSSHTRMVGFVRIKAVN